MPQSDTPEKPGTSTASVPISISISDDLLQEIDKRARSMGINRSQYFATLAVADLHEKGTLILRPVYPLKRRRKG